MAIDQVSLHFAPGSSWACVRELCGCDEQSVEGTGTMAAIRLLDRLLVAAPGTDIGPGNAKILTTADRDRLLATIYMRSYSSRIESIGHCHNCDAPFDIDFSLEELISHLYSGTSTTKVEKGPDGVYELPGGHHFRLPTGEDECAILSMAPKEAERALLARCVADGDITGKSEVLQRAMKDVAPIVDLELEVCCPECSQQQMVHFDIQYYLLAALQQERKQLALEIHRLATAYSWSLNEILELPRSMRRMYVALVESELDSRRRRRT